MYELDENMKPVNSMQFLGDEETVKKAIESVAAQVQGVPINMGIKGIVIEFLSVSQLYPEKLCLIKYELDIHVYVLETHLGKNAKFSRNNKCQKIGKTKCKYFAKTNTGEKFCFAINRCSCTTCGFRGIFFAKL